MSWNGCESTDDGIKISRKSWCCSVRLSSTADVEITEPQELWLGECRLDFLRDGLLRVLCCIGTRGGSWGAVLTVWWAVNTGGSMWHTVPTAPTTSAITPLLDVLQSARDLRTIESAKRTMTIWNSLMRKYNKNFKTFKNVCTLLSLNFLPAKCSLWWPANKAMTNISLWHSRWRKNLASRFRYEMMVKIKVCDTDTALYMYTVSTCFLLCFSTSTINLSTLMHKKWPPFWDFSKDVYVSVSAQNETIHAVSMPACYCDPITLCSLPACCCNPVTHDNTCCSSTYLPLSLLYIHDDNMTLQ